MIKMLGHGNFGEVWKASLHDCANPGVPEYRCAVKTVVETTGDDAAGAAAAESDLLNEALFMAQVDQHKHLVLLIGVVTRGTPKMLVLSFCEHGELQGALKKRAADGMPCDLGFKYRFCQEIGDGMQHLAGHALVHRDRAARNVLLASGMVCKVGHHRSRHHQHHSPGHGAADPAPNPRTNAGCQRRLRQTAAGGAAAAHRPRRQHSLRERRPLLLRASRRREPPRPPQASRHSFAALASATMRALRDGLQGVSPAGRFEASAALALLRAKAVSVRAQHTACPNAKQDEMPVLCHPHTFGYPNRSSLVGALASWLVARWLVSSCGPHAMPHHHVPTMKNFCFTRNAAARLCPALGVLENGTPAGARD